MFLIYNLIFFGITLTFWRQSLKIIWLKILQTKFLETVGSQQYFRQNSNFRRIFANKKVNFRNNMVTIIFALTVYIQCTDVVNYIDALYTLYSNMSIYNPIMHLPPKAWWLYTMNINYVIIRMMCDIIGN